MPSSTIWHARNEVPSHSSVCCILRYSIGRHAIQRCTLVRGSGFKMKNTMRSRNSTKWISSLQSREPTLGSARYSHLQILFPKAFHCLNSYVRVSTVDPRSSHTALSIYTNKRARTRPPSLLTKPVVKLGTVLTRTCAPQKLVHTTCFVILHWGSLL